MGLLHFERALGSNAISTEDLWRLSEGSAKYTSAVESWKADCVALLAAKLREARQFVDVGTVVLLAVKMFLSIFIDGSVKSPITSSDRVYSATRGVSIGDPGSLIPTPESVGSHPTEPVRRAR